MRSASTAPEIETSVVALLIIGSIRWFGFFIILAAERLFDIRGGPLETLKILKFQRVADVAAGAGVKSPPP